MKFIRLQILFLLFISFALGELSQSSDLKCSACEIVLKKHAIKVKTGFRKIKDGKYKKALPAIQKGTITAFNGRKWAIKTDEEKEWYEDLGTRTVPEYILKGDPQYLRMESSKVIKETVKHLVADEIDLVISTYEKHGKKFSGKNHLVPAICVKYCSKEKSEL